MMQWALLGLLILFLLVAYVIIQGTRAAMAWRKAAAAGDVKVIRDILEETIASWRSAKRPKTIAPEVWRGIQSTQAVDVGPGFVRVSLQAEGEYRLKEGRWVEVRDALQEGMAVTAKAAEMLFYELPHFRPERIQVDVYSTFQDPAGPARRVCILTTAVDREKARQVDWDEWTGEQIVDALGGRYRLGDAGQPLPVDVEPPVKPVATRPNGSKPGRAA